MSKKIILTLLVLILTLTSLPFSAFAADTLKLQRININRGGFITSIPVLRDSKDNIYVHQSWLCDLGSMECKESETEYEYYYPEQESQKNYAKRIFINKESNEFSVCYYYCDSYFAKQIVKNSNWLLDENTEITEKEEEIVLNFFTSLESAKQEAREYIRSKYIPIVQDRFTDVKEYNGERWVRLEELFPLLQDGMFISEENGMININPHKGNIFRTLYNAEVSSVVFNADVDIAGNEFMAFTGNIIDGFVSKRYNRFDILFKSGRKEDYENIFKSLLTDNDVYLKAVQNGLDSDYKNSDYVKDLLSFSDSATDMVNTTYSYYDKAEIESYFFDETEGLISPETKSVYASDFISGVEKIYSYWHSYKYQIEDHRNMLDSVYNYDIATSSKKEAKKKKKYPSYKAANNIIQLYRKDTSDLTIVKVGLRDYLSEKATNYLATKAFDGVLLPWSVASTITKGLLKAYSDSYDMIEAAAILEHMDNCADISYKVYLSRQNSLKTDTESLNGLRLSGLMTLLISKNAYNLYGIKQELIPQIDEMLIEFYLASDGIECQSSEYYAQKKQELKDTLKYLTPVDEDDLKTISLGEFIGKYPHEVKMYPWDSITSQYDGTCIDTTTGDLIFKFEFDDWYNSGSNSTYYALVMDKNNGKSGYNVLKNSRLDLYPDGETDTVIDKLSLGMTYKEVKQKLGNPYEMKGSRPWEYTHITEPITQPLWYEEVLVYVGCSLVLLFNGSGEDAVLVGAILSYYE